MEARDYQARCCEAILSAVDAGHKAILCDLFTGAGKTFSLSKAKSKQSPLLTIGSFCMARWWWF